jgi:aspartate/methionine/tyrosine aminotransferase
LSLSEKPPRLARRMSGIEPFHVMELLARAKNLEAQGRSIIHMEIGEPDFPTPRPICEAAMRALQNGETFYTAACGLPALREGIARYYSTRYGVNVSPERIVVTSGSSAALLLTLGVLVNPGDQVLLTDPGYPASRHFVRLLDATAVNVPVNADSNYQMTPELLEYHWGVNTVAALLASPSNPTGTLIPSEHLRQMAAHAARQGGALVVDEIYHGLVYESEAKTALELGEDVFVINSFSKYFNMTGWRLGWVVAPLTYVREIDKLAQNIYLSPSTPAQHAALAAFEPETLAILDARRDELRERRDYLVPQLRDLGFNIPQTPDGAFYIYAGCSRLTHDSYSFTMDLLEKAGVAITPGIDFGAHRAAEHVRFAYTAAMPQLKEGVTRIRDFVADRRR